MPSQILNTNLEKHIQAIIEHSDGSSHFTSTEREIQNFHQRQVQNQQRARPPQNSSLIPTTRKDKRLSVGPEKKGEKQPRKPSSLLIAELAIGQSMAGNGTDDVNEP